jgi:GntR family transcriptional regulator, rspAB operon transcriptional repressor
LGVEVFGFATLFAYYYRTVKDHPELGTLSAEAYESVRQRILRGELSLGEAISRRKIAAELGMSFLPVSEALMRLEFEGLLESRPRAGTRVRIPSREDVQGHYIVREALESQAARLFAELATPAERAEVTKLAARVDALYKKPARLHYLELHERLHRRIAECARCPALSHAIEQTHSLASTWFCVQSGPMLEALDRPHQDLVRGLCEGDQETAAEAMRKHVKKSLERTMIRLDAYFQLRDARGRKFIRKRPRALQS